MMFIVLVSIVLHGVTVTPVMRFLDWRQRTGHTAREMAAAAAPARK
jgi:NhaP-type Na+/H+ or K+/H+ antiporter